MALLDPRAKSTKGLILRGTMQISSGPLRMSQYRVQSHDEVMEEKQEIQQVEEINRNDGFAQQAQDETLSEAKSSWKVLLANPRALFVILAVQTNAIIVGIEFSLPGNLLGIPAFNKQFGYFSESLGAYTVEAQHLSIWAALFATFQVFGQFTGGYVSDRWGRKMSLWLVILFTYAGVVLEVVALTWQQWLGSKIIIGFATGIMQSAVPTYVAEVAPREVRGIALSFFNMAMNIGGLAATLIPWATAKKYPDIDNLLSFRIPLYVALAVPTITLVLEIFFVPESPYWLCMKNRKADARKAISRIYPKMLDNELDLQLAQLEYTLAKEAELDAQMANSSYLDCFKGIDARRTFCAVFPPITQNLSGQNLAGTYATYFFTLAKQEDPLISTLITTAVGLAANFASFFLIENKRIGRWLLLFVGIIIMTSCMLGIALIDTIQKSVFNYKAGVMLVFFVALFIAASTIGPGVAGWAYTGESGSARLRAKTTTLGTVGNALVGLVMTTCLPFLLEKAGAKTAYMFFALGCICIAGIYLFVPDFTGRSFGQIDELFHRKIPARRFKSTVCDGNYGNSVAVTSAHNIVTAERDA